MERKNAHEDTLAKVAGLVGPDTGEVRTASS